MQVETLWDGPVFVVRISGNRQPFAVYRIIGSLAFAACAEILVRRSWLQGAAVTTGGTFAIYNICDVQFGISEMRVDESSITFTRRITKFKRSRSFPRSDIEKLGYLRGNDKEYPALGMMIRTLIMPFHFGKGIAYEEAKSLLSTIAASNTWLASKTLSVDRPLF